MTDERKSPEVRSGRPGSGTFTRRRVIGAGAAGLAGMAAAGGLPRSAAAQDESGESGPGVVGGQVALVTGAGRGIGRACAVALAREGADVAVLDIAHDIEGHPVPMATPGDLAETVRLIEGEGRRAIAIQADVRRMGPMQGAADRVIDELGGIDVLVANAGINAATPLVGMDAGEADTNWENVVGVNLVGTANSMRAVLSHMTERERGRIIVMTSTFGRQGNGENSNYVASKWGLIGLVKAAAIEAGPRNVTVNAVAPTGVRTGLGGPQTEEERAEADELFQSSYHFLPVGSLLPDDIGGTVVFLASPAARYISGVTVDVAAGANARYTA